jgi:predicted amidohydrolase
VAALQYFMRPVRTFDEFKQQVVGLVDTAADYKTHLMLFPEYFTTQLLTLGDVRRPIAEQVRDLADQRELFEELMRREAARSGIHILAGTLPVWDDHYQQLFNQGYLFSPSGGMGVQRKLHMTRFESEEWMIAAGHRLRVFDTELGRMAITICYDVEFPELARAAARAGAELLLVPTCTDDRQGYLRVRYCAQARAIENQLYVVQACTVGSIPMVPAISLNYGQAAIMTPSDFAFARDGIRAEGVPNEESMVIADLDMSLLAEGRESGTVLPLRDSQSTARVIADLEMVVL